MRRRGNEKLYNCCYRQTHGKYFSAHQKHQALLQSCKTRVPFGPLFESYSLNIKQMALIRNLEQKHPQSRERKASTSQESAMLGLGGPTEKSASQPSGKPRELRVFQGEKSQIAPPMSLRAGGLKIEHCVLAPHPISNGLLWIKAELTATAVCKATKCFCCLVDFVSVGPEV